MTDFETLGEMRRRALAALIPPARLPLSEWIEANVKLPDISAAPGPMRLWPYQRGLADALGDPAIERVSVVKAARIGMTSLFTAAIGHFAVNDPSPILCVLPTESDARDYVGSDLEPTFAASPALAGVLSGNLIGQRGKSRSTMLSRQFPGGSLRIVASHAPRNLRAKTARVLFVDEADAMLESGAEGSPISLAERRTLSFSDRKICICSTPIDEETSHVLRLYEAGDCREWRVPCPACGTETEILWEHITWTPGEPETAAFACPHCGVVSAEADVKAQQGRWVITRPEVKGHASFRINALVSTLHNARWGVLAGEFLAAKDDPLLLKPFVNLVLAQGWRQQGDELDEGSLLSRVEPFGLDRIPPAVLCIVCGVDVQSDSLHCTFAGFTRISGECFVLAHVVLHGPTDQEPVWQDLDDRLKQRWQHPHGGMIGVDAAAIDAGSGSHFDRVLRFCAARAARRVYAIKGAAGFGRPAFKQSAGLRSRGAQRLFIVGVDSLKLALFERLKRGALIRFSDSLDASFFEELTSERLVTKYSRGRPERRFELGVGKRNESLDTVIYCHAAREGCAIALDAREAALKLQPASTVPPRVSRSRWLDGL
ncbi:phage terminase large subunit family protein [Methylocella sp.]|jgi:phage terminase large subunit GpA-like protein|uniref:phage terminase large subunit family protein n=1 Tax=Methylocella sp. TaxID=1978226 RepID=UPI003C145D9D